MAILGLKPTSAPGNTHAVSANTQIATSRGAQALKVSSGGIRATDNGWITHLGVWANKVSGAPKAQLAAWANQSSPADVPGMLLGRTAPLLISTSAANNEGAIVNAGGQAANVIRIASGAIVHIGLSLEGGAILIGQQNTLGPSNPGLVATFHKAVSAGTLTSPFTPDGSIADGALAVYAVFVANSAPNAPTGLTPANGTATNDATPTLGGAFSDPDVGLGYPDKLWAYEFEVRDNASDALLWGGATALFAANSTEQTAGSYSRPYNGTALTEGVTVKWRTRCYDLSGTPGAWSSFRTLTLDANANVTMTAPSGKVDGPTEEIGWAGKYNHPSATASTHMQVRFSFTSNCSS